MAEHLYVLSNPSVPGVVKVGKTSSSLDQKLAELHASDDPIPLLLEFYATVKDGDASEKAAHEALAKFRIDAEHKFFRTSVAHVIETIVPVIGEHTAHDVSEVNRPLTPDELHVRRQMLAHKRETERKTREMLREKAEREARKERKRAIESAIIQEARAIKRLGPRPVKSNLPLFWFACMFCFSPLPLGWIFWTGSVGVFFKASFYFGCASIVLVLFGYLAHRADLMNDQMYRKAMEPYEPIDARIRELQQELLTLRMAARKPS